MTVPSSPVVHCLLSICHGDLDEFFQHEDQACTLSLSQMGSLRTGTKSDLMPCLEKNVAVKEHLSTPRVHVNTVAVDGADQYSAIGHCIDVPRLCHISQPSFKTEWKLSGMCKWQQV